GEIQQPEENKKKSKLPIAAIGYSLAMGGIMLAYYSISTNIALFLEQNEIGGATLAGLVVSFTTVGGMITSLSLVHIEMALKKFVIPVMLFGMGGAFFILSFTNSVPLVILSVCLVGFGQGSLFPILVLKDSVPLHQADQAVAMTSSFTFLGQFLSPVVLDGIGKIANTDNIRFQYGTLSVVIMVVVFISTFAIIRSTKRLPSAN